MHLHVHCMQGWVIVIVHTCKYRKLLGVGYFQGVESAWFGRGQCLTETAENLFFECWALGKWRRRSILPLGAASQVQLKRHAKAQPLIYEVLLCNKQISLPNFCLRGQLCRQRDVQRPLLSHELLLWDAKLAYYVREGMCGRCEIEHHFSTHFWHSLIIFKSLCYVWTVNNLVVIVSSHKHPLVFTIQYNRPE